MPLSNDKEERETALYHGTTLDVAELIVARKSFDCRETFFASTRELARYFAVHSTGKVRRAQSPAIVRVALYETDLNDWKRNRLVASTSFDEGDATALRGKTQLVFSSEGIRMLNSHMFSGDLAFETLHAGA